jgi:translation initiation factor 3 subunit F
LKALHFTPTQIAIDVVHHQTMLALQQKVNPRDRIVGWFSTGTDLAGSDALIHNFYADQCAKPVHLVLDTTLQNARMSVKAFVSRLLTLKGRELAREFQEVPCEIRTVETERAAGDVLAHEVVEKLPSEGEGLVASLEKLRRTLAAAEAYVADVVEGRRSANVAVGRQLAEAMAAIPRFVPEELAKLVRDNQNDVLLTAYLAGLVKAHIALADKLGTMQLPLL